MIQPHDTVTHRARPLTLVGSIEALLPPNPHSAKHAIVRWADNTVSIEALIDLKKEGEATP